MTDSYKKWKKLPSCGSKTACAFRLESGKCDFPPILNRCKNRIFPDAKEEVEFS